ncbi:MAG TPA: DUF4097 family beta strand repeat-containing protein [Lysobacter sp.]|nr:DUF4097 family beta strand repeat-containing protein [Lysobacter sp.]
MTSLRTLFLGAALALAIVPAWAATPINETRPLDARGRIEIENIKGLIEVRAWDRPEVRIQGSLGEGVEKLEIDGDRSRLAVRVRYPKRSGWNWGQDRSEPTELRLMVPRLASLHVESVAADVDIEGVASRELHVDAVSGDVRVAAAPGEADAQTVSGDLHLTLNTSDVNAQTVSGDLTLRGRLDGEVHAETVSGNLDVRVLQNRLREVNASSVSGDIHIQTALAADAQLAVETVSGDVRLVLPRDVSATVRGESFSGDLRAPGANIQRPKHGPGASFEHRYGSGSADVRLETFSGDATLQLD